MSKRKYSLGMVLMMALALGTMFVASEALAGGGGPPGDLCGNNVIDPGETCDDGNKIDCDGCDSAGSTGQAGACTISACGNDVLCTTSTDPNQFPIEQCDPPNGTTCDNSCMLVPQALTKQQQKCVNNINKKALQLVEKAQAKENEKCVKDFQKGKLAGTVEACLTADSKGKVDKKKQGTVKADDKDCTGKPPVPTFAYTNAGTANTAAMLAPINIIHAMFGNPIVADDVDPNTALVTSGQNKDTAKCQLEMLKRANKLDDALVKETLKAKKDALKGKKVPQATTATDLETQLNLILSSPVKAAKAAAKLRSGTDKKCADLLYPNKRFQGFCGGKASLAETQDCVIGATVCDVCRKFEAADMLDLDCDAAAAAAGGACTPIM